MQAQDIYKDFFTDKNTVVAHRGAWKKNGIPQNSIESLREAIRLGCAGTEFDVHMTADSILVLCHDNDYLGKIIEDNTYEELSKIKLPNGEMLPTLDKVLMEGMKQTNTRFFLEIKNSSTKERTLISARRIVEMVNRLGAHPWIFYIAFDYDVAKVVKKLSPHSAVAYLNGDISPEQLAKDNFTGLDYNHSVYKKNEAIIEESKKLGLSLNVWTVNSPNDMNYFMSHAFDYITTDEPELLLEKQIPK